MLLRVWQILPINPISSNEPRGRRAIVLLSSAVDFYRGSLLFLLSFIVSFIFFFSSPSAFLPSLCCFPPAPALAASGVMYHACPVHGQANNICVMCRCYAGRQVWGKHSPKKIPHLPNCIDSCSSQPRIDGSWVN